MTDSADTSRQTPYQLIFGEDVFDVSQFEAVREQADAHQAETPDQLFMLPAAGDLLRALSPPEGDRETVAQLRALLFSAYRHWRHDRHVYRIDQPLLRSLIAPDHVPATAPRPPAPAGYVQLPRNAVWARVAEDAAPEPIDGFFWSIPHGAPADARLDLLFALGLRAGRPGLSLFDVSLEAAAQLDDWMAVKVRPDGEDFANVMPGGELQDYRSITTRAEALKLAALCFSCIADPKLEWSSVDDNGEKVHGPANG